MNKLQIYVPEKTTIYADWEDGDDIVFVSMTPVDGIGSLDGGVYFYTDINNKEHLSDKFVKLSDYEYQVAANKKLKNQLDKIKKRQHNLRKKA